MSGDAETSTSDFVVSWKKVAIVSTLATLGLLATLAIVGARVGAAALSTTALSLAIIAFAAQLIVYIAQTADTSEMRRQAFEVNASTQSSLSQIRTTVEKSDLMLRDQNGVLINHLLDEVKRKQVELKDSDSSLDASDVIDVIAAARSGATGSGIGARHPGRGREDSRRGRQLSDDDAWGDAWGDDDSFESFDSFFGDWPDGDDAERLYAVLSTLDPVSIGQLMRFAEDHELSARLKSTPGLIYSGPEGSPFSHQLVRAGLVKSAGRYPPGRPPKTGFRPVYSTLTDDGVVAAQLIMARGEAPEHIKRLLRTRGETSSVPSET